MARAGEGNFVLRRRLRRLDGMTTVSRRDGTLRWVVEQGFEMGRPSMLEVEADVTGGAVIGVRVGGDTVLVAEGTMAIS